jgi:hypothetical protein
MTLPTSAPSDLIGGFSFYYVAWLDIVGDPLRATTLPTAIAGAYSFSGTGDADLDGYPFIYLPSELVDIGPATHNQSGSDTVTATLSGIAGPDDGLLAALSTPANYKGRTGRLWRGKMTAAGVPLTLDPYYTGWMTSAKLAGSPAGGSTVAMTLENYLAIITSARGRTYQDQAEFDVADVSPARIRASANGVSGAGIIPNVGSARTFGDSFNVREQ